MSPPEPELSPAQAAELRRGVEQFNSRYFFECHDTLEELWSELRGPSRDFFQGLIQVSVGFYHLGNGNRSGATSMLQRALRRFEGYPERYFGFDLATHREELRGWLRRIQADGPEELVGDPPSWRFEDPPAAREPARGSL